MLPRSFYDRSTFTVAQDLLGCFLVRQLPDGTLLRVMITETEAYDGPKDKASHASRGRTPRTAVMFGPPGIAYVYFCYGVHWLLNIVSRERDYPAAVLIRGAAILPSMATRSRWGEQPPVLSGPAKLTKALEIDGSFNGLPLYNEKAGLYLESRTGARPRITRGKRIGVDYAGEYKDKLWRYTIKQDG